MSIKKNPVDEPSLCVASLKGKAVAMTFGSKLIIARYPVTDDHVPSPLNSVLVDDQQLIRAVAFLRIPDGPLCVVTAGDSKFINVYNISSWKQNNPNAVEDDEKPGSDGEDDDAYAKKVAASQEHRAQLAQAQKWVPSYQYGPHTKRISNLVTSDDGTIIFADKFGEVYRLRLSWSPEHTIEVDGDTSKPAAFLLQHFSIMSTVFLSSPVPRLEGVAASEERSAVSCRRLFTCDKDRHARVSRYPEAYQIEQFLWNKKENPSSVTAVVEIPYSDSDDLYTAFGSPEQRRKRHDANKSDRYFNVPLSYYATGDFDGIVNFWVADNEVPAASNQEPFHSIGSYNAPRELGKDVGPVVAMSYVCADLDRYGVKRHPADTPRGVLVAYQNVPDIVFVPLYDGIGSVGLRPAVVSAVSIEIEACPVAMVNCNTSGAMVLLRDGQVKLLKLVEVAPASAEADKEAGTAKKICVINDRVHVTVEERPMEMPFLEERIKAVMCQPASGSAAKETQLQKLDLFEQWRQEAVDPRARKHDREGDEDEDEDEEKEATKSGAASKTDKRKKKQE